MLTVLDTVRADRRKAATLSVEPRKSVVKRTIDIILATCALAFLSPGLLLIAVCLLIADGRPIMFRQNRIGVRGETFQCLKFRTMRRDAAERLAEILAADEERRSEWERDQKLSSDPRVHWVGKFLRVSSLDELPQLLNVIMGQMSIVGPRPIVQNELEKYGEHRNFYLAMTPGITGLWQISGRNQTTYDERVSLDVRYFHEQSIWLDLRIMLRTVPVLLYAHTGQ